MSHDFALPLIMIFSVGSLFVAGYLISWVLKKDTGTPAMREISNAIKEGAEAFLKRQNTTIVLLAAVWTSPALRRTLGAISLPAVHGVQLYRAIGATD